LLGKAQSAAHALEPLSARNRKLFQGITSSWRPPRALIIRQLDVAAAVASLHRARKPRAAKRQPDTPQSSTTDQSGRLHRSSQCPFVVTRRCRVQAHPKDGGDEQMFGAK
jgi:hypothetical protein